MNSIARELDVPVFARTRGSPVETAEHSVAHPQCLLELRESLHPVDFEAEAAACAGYCDPV